MQLDSHQLQALDVLQGGHNAFLTGSAGTGKSTVTAAFIGASLRKIDVCATTGIAMLLKQALAALDAPAEVMQMLADGDLNNLSLWLFTEAKPKDIEIGRLQIELRELIKLIEHHRSQVIQRSIERRDDRVKTEALEMILQSFMNGADTEEIEALVKGAIATMRFEAENFTPGSDVVSADRVAWEGFTKGIVAGISALEPTLHEALKGAVEEAITAIHHRHPEVPINEVSDAAH